jgi:NADH-quinone oxidoreductase subunit E
MEKYPPGKQASAVIPVLWRAQEQNDGWVSEPAIRYVAELVGLSYIRAYEVATFYTMFQLARWAARRMSRSAAPRHACCAGPAI